jgi:putative FmdB family regulatory protein
VPTYEYVCLSCGTHVEVYQRFSDEPLTECGVCGGRLRRVFHPAGILFKGSGFYATDSRGSRSKGASESDSGASKREGATAESASKGAGSSKGESSRGERTSKPEGGSTASSKERSA